MSRSKPFRLIMISAMYENGGNTLQRHLDAHPELYVYPFESQVGTFMVTDYMSSLFPHRYRWSEFELAGNFNRDYEEIIDEEYKKQVNTPHVSKFRHVADLGTTDKARKGLFLKFLKGKERTRTNIIEAFFRSTFLAWKTYNKTGKESIYVGYSPIVGVDADKIFGDFPKAIILHIVRNPYAAFAETKRRPVPYTLDRYTRIWNFMQLTALNFANAYPKQFLVVRYEDMVANKRKFFQELSKKLGILYSETMEYPSWNGKKLERQYPWGTINIPNDEVNKATIKELSKLEYERIKSQTQVLNKILGYDGI